jgi:hemerythrin
MLEGTTTMGVLFVWDEAYCIGVHEVDEQHRHLFDLANALPEDPTGVDIKRAVMGLYRHTREHFVFEEALMLKMGYPKREEHVRLHERLTSQLNACCCASDPDTESILAIKRLIHEWVVAHIATHDRDYARFAQKLEHAGI